MTFADLSAALQHVDIALIVGAVWYLGQRLQALTDQIKQQNGRVSRLEAWREDHTNAELDNLRAQVAT